MAELLPLKKSRGSVFATPTGVSVWSLSNSIHLRQIDSQFSTIRQGMRQIQNKVRGNADAIQKLSIAGEHLYAFTPKSIAQL